MSRLYDDIGVGYARNRRPDPRIAARIAAALDGCATIVNVGAGAGSYEPTEGVVASVEPSAVMLAQHPGRRRVRGVAEALPFPDGTFDGSLASITIHHWADWRQGLREMRRVSRRQVVFGYRAGRGEGHWIVDDYLPEVELEGPTLEEVACELGAVRLVEVPIPHDCTDGFLAAYWRRPERYLDLDVVASISGIAVLPEDVRAAGLARLAADLESGRWHDRHGHLLELDELETGYCLVIAGA